MTQYAIFEGNYERLMKKLTTIENKCKKYGCSFSFKEVGEEYRDVKTEDGNIVTRRFVLVEAEGIAKENGWIFVATLEHTEKGNIISKAVEGFEVPERYYDAKPVCEHCKTSRARKDTYIVYNEETGEYKQVGKSCLRDFTNGLSAEGVAKYLSWFEEIIEAEEVPCGCGWAKRYYNTKKYLAYVAECVNKFGYVRTCDTAQPTATFAIDVYEYLEFGRKPYFDDKSNIRFAEKLETVSFDANSEKVQSVVEDALVWLSKQDCSNNYMHNLKVACSLEYCHQFGIVASLMPTFNRELEREAEKREKALREAAEGKLSNWVGNVGDRIKFFCGNPSVISSWSTKFGTTYVYKMTDDNGNVYTWKTGKFIPDEERFSFVGTVKEHKEYRDIKQTELTRCSFDVA